MERDVGTAADAGLAGTHVVVDGVRRRGREAGRDVVPAYDGRQNGRAVHPVVGRDEISVDEKRAFVIGIAAPAGDPAAVGLDRLKARNDGGRLWIRDVDRARVVGRRQAPVCGIGGGSWIRLPGGGIDRAVQAETVDAVVAAVFDHVTLDGDIARDDGADDQVGRLRRVRKGHNVVFHRGGHAERGKFHPGLAEIDGIPQGEIPGAGARRGGPELQCHIRAAGGIGDELPVGTHSPAGLIEGVGAVGDVGAGAVRQRTPAIGGGGGQTHGAREIPLGDRIAHERGVNETAGRRISGILARSAGLPALGPGRRFGGGFPALPDLTGKEDFIDAGGSCLGDLSTVALACEVVCNAQTYQEVDALRCVRQIEALLLQGACVCDRVFSEHVPALAEVCRPCGFKMRRSRTGGQHLGLKRHSGAAGGVEDQHPAVVHAPAVHAQRTLAVGKRSVRARVDPAPALDGGGRQRSQAVEMDIGKRI